MDRNRRILYLSQLDVTFRRLYRNKIYDFLSGLNRGYPGFKGWYNRLFSENNLKSGREIAFIIAEGQIIAASIWKNSEEEKKICTLKVADSFRSQGLGRVLMEAGFAWLETETPFFSLDSEQEIQFSNLFTYYGFYANEWKQGYYRFGKKELVYNGSLPEKYFWINRIKVRNIEKEIYRFILRYGEQFDKNLLKQCLMGNYIHE